MPNWLFANFSGCTVFDLTFAILGILPNNRSFLWHFKLKNNMKNEKKFGVTKKTKIFLGVDTGVNTCWCRCWWDFWKMVGVGVGVIFSKNESSDLNLWNEFVCLSVCIIKLETNTKHSLNKFILVSNYNNRITITCEQKFTRLSMAIRLLQLMGRLKTCN